MDCVIIALQHPHQDKTPHWFLEDIKDEMSAQVLTSGLAAHSGYLQQLKEAQACRELSPEMKAA